MTVVARACAAVAAAAMLGGCVTAAPGADQVQLTRKPADVVGCTPAGNLSPESTTPPVVLKNMAVGLNANTILLTGAYPIAYRCGNEAPPVQQCPANCTPAGGTQSAK
jgi:hypothetical protein